MVLLPDLTEQIARSAPNATGAPSGRRPSPPSTAGTLTRARRAGKYVVMPLTDKALEAVLAADDWPFERLDATTWRSGFQAPGQRKVRFFLRLTDNWLFLTIIPFAMLPEDDDDAERALMRRLLELNRRITLAKFAVEHREVVLTVELPTQDLSPSQIKDGLDALSLYASLHYAAIVEFAAPAP